ncbi:MAG: hypothetical protein J5733_02700, partial [Bacteroidaceae bacterium]|nr:hypothetical protein [Bacteroidaceae bacterium]
MKKFLILLLCLPAYSQSMTVNTLSGNATSFPTNQVSSVTFSEETSGQTTPANKIQMKRSIVFLGHSIWRNDNYNVRYQNSGSFVTPFTGTFKGRGYQTLLQEVFDFPAAYSPGPDGGYSGYSLGGTSATDSKSIAVVAGQANNGWPSVQNAIWTIDFITNDFKRNVPLGT